MSNPPPLSGFKVVDMTEAMAGPYCSMLLGDLGADVVKIERPGAGDQSRGWGPPFLDGESAYFLSVNRNKRSIELDIKRPDELALLHALVDERRRLPHEQSAHGLPRGGRARPRYDPRAQPPRSSTSPSAATAIPAPTPGRAGYDIIAQGEAGLMALTGPPDDGPSRFPTPMADISAGIYATIGALAALYGRDREAPGREGAVSRRRARRRAGELARESRRKLLRERRAPRAPRQRAPHRYALPAGAGPRQAHDRRGRQRAPMGAVLRRARRVEDTLRADSRFATNADRNRHRGELIPLLERVLIERDAAEWIEGLVAAGVPAGPINFPDDTLGDPHIAARKLIVELDHPLLGVVRSIGLPVRFAGGGVTYRRHPPPLGEHTA